MNRVELALALIPFMPFVGFLINGLFGKRLGRSLAASVACAGPIAGFVCSMWLLRVLLAGGDNTVVEVTLWTWMSTDVLTIDIGLVADRLSIVLLLVVTGVGSLIHIYSTEYMADEHKGSYARYFAYLNLFTAMMLVLITARSLPLMFVGWEGVGLCSYLLIGFWYTDEKNASAGRKAFIVNRVGDFAFVLGMLTLLFGVVGPALTDMGLSAVTHRLDMDVINTVSQHVGAAYGGRLALSAVLLFVGACGKSAQIPLHVWLPDAMAGPTPVSALIHAATMVTAGVYMVARLGGLFSVAPGALEFVAIVGVTTAFAAATMALREMDLKKVLAYSTISQLGYMFVGVGTGLFASGVFHLVTHAFFKALLFLGAGAVMHAVHTMDMRRMGGLRHRMPWTFVLFVVGSAALAGIPGTSGFFSKDEILAGALINAFNERSAVWMVIWFVGVVTAILTAFYIARAVAMTFLGEARETGAAFEHAHDPGPRMKWPLVVLAVLALFGGFMNVPHLLGGHADFTQFLAPVMHAQVGELASHHGGLPHSVEWGAMLLTVAGGLFAVCLAIAIFVRTPHVDDYVSSNRLVAPVARALDNKWGFDLIYGRWIVRPLLKAAKDLWRAVDVEVIDGALHALADTVKSWGRRLRELHTGALARYVSYVTAGALIVLMLMLGYI